MTIKIATVSQSVSASESGWHSGSAAKIVALLALIALAAWVIDLFVPTVELPFAAWLIAGGAGAISILFVLYKLVSKPGGNVSVDVPGVHASVGTAYGIWVSLLAAIAVVVGAWLSMTESQRQQHHAAGGSTADGAHQHVAGVVDAQVDTRQRDQAGQSQ